jgi:hypothetical protein
LAARNPSQAVTNFLNPLNRVLSCLTKDIIVASGCDLNKIEAASLNKGAPSRLRSNPAFFLSVLIQYKLTKAEGERGPWKVSTAAYAYGLHDKEQSEIISYHWHPGVGRRYPHLHLGAGSGVAQYLEKVHVPTRRISLEEILRFAIEELRVRPLRRDWEKVLELAQSQFEKFRTWG